MTSAIDPVELASRLIACPSVTPATGEVFDVLEAALAGIGFEVHRFVLGEAPDGPAENLVAMRGGEGTHFGFAGHLDVVPAGAGWSSDPFVPEVRGGLLYGRAALDALHLDDGNDTFQPSNLEMTAVETGSKATNVIPGSARIQLNIRFNNLQRGEDLVALVRRTVEGAAPNATVDAKISGEAFLT